MKTMEDVLSMLKEQDLESYKALMAYCDTRVTADEGIPAIIGLDDLTATWNTTYEGAKNDEKFHMMMAAGAMIFASLYEQKTPEELGHYPGIAPAMSAVAEMFFRMDENGEAVPYRDVVGQFIKEQEDKK